MLDLKPVDCGCGGKPNKYESPITGRILLECNTCGIETKFYDTEAEAVQAWNRAMGAGKNKLAITKGYWIVTYDGLYCSVCNYKCETTAVPNVCPCCSADMRG